MISTHFFVGRPDFRLELFQIFLQNSTLERILLYLVFLLKIIQNSFGILKEFGSQFRLKRQLTSSIKVEKILKSSLYLIPSPSNSVKIQIVCGKICLRCKGKTPSVVIKLLKTKSLLTSQCFALLLQVKFPAMGLNPGYLLKYFLLSTKGISFQIYLRLNPNQICLDNM